ncbi:MAG: protein-L-isoaspartate O-methyltransferase family protein [Acidimicrobiia bacterium]
MRSLADVAASAGITDARVLDAMRAVPRARFVPTDQVRDADRDVPIPIGHDQVTTQPSLVAAMIQALDLGGGETVLEIGSGYGYQTALLARLAAAVWSVEWWDDLAAAARANLASAGIRNAHVVTGDGTLGLPDRAPFDGIVVAAAFPDVPPPLVDQLAPGGRLVQPLGHGGDEDVVVFARHDDGLRRIGHVTYARFVRLVGTHGFTAT